MATLVVLFAVVLVGGAGSPLRCNSLRTVNESGDLVTELGGVYSGDPVWSGNWLPEDLTTDTGHGAVQRVGGSNCAGGSQPLPVGTNHFEVALRMTTAGQEEPLGAVRVAQTALGV